MSLLQSTARPPSEPTDIFTSLATAADTTQVATCICLRKCLLH